MSTKRRRWGRARAGTGGGGWPPRDAASREALLGWTEGRAELGEQRDAGRAIPDEEPAAFGCEHGDAGLLAQELTLRHSDERRCGRGGAAVAEGDRCCAD